MDFGQHPTDAIDWNSLKKYLFILNVYTLLFMWITFNPHLNFKYDLINPYKSQTFLLKEIH